MSIINTLIKPFKVNAYLKGKFLEISNISIKGKWSVFFFYPADFTFICPTELRDLSKNYLEFKKINTEIYGISTDTHFAHKVWCDTSVSMKNIQYPLLGDSAGVLSRNFDVYIENSGLSLRGTFIINPEGIIKSLEINDNNFGRNILELLRKLKAAQYVENNPGEVCPVNWNNNIKTLKPSLSLVGKI